MRFKETIIEIRARDSIAMICQENNIWKVFGIKGNGKDLPRLCFFLSKYFNAVYFTEAPIGYLNKKVLSI